LMALIQFNI